MLPFLQVQAWGLEPQGKYSLSAGIFLTHKEDIPVNWGTRGCLRRSNKVTEIHEAVDVNMLRVASRPQCQWLPDRAGHKHVRHVLKLCSKLICVIRCYR